LDVRYRACDCPRGLIGKVGIFPARLGHENVGCPQRRDRSTATAKPTLSISRATGEDQSYQLKLVDVKGEARVFYARTEERFNSVEQRLGSLEDRTKAQDRRLWTFVTALVLAALGTIAKLAFFPSA
jgi:hypothetical protein